MFCQRGIVHTPNMRNFYQNDDTNKTKNKKIYFNIKNQHHEDAIG